MLAAVLCVACSKDENGSNANDFVKVEISILNGTKATKAVTAPVTSADVACANVADLTALFADASGKVVKSASFPSAASGPYTFSDVPAEVAQVAVIALRGASVPVDLEAAVTLWETEDVAAEAAELVVYGVDAAPTRDAGTDGALVLKASVTVLPAHARIQVSGISCTDLGDFTSITLKKMAMASGKYAQDLGSVALTSAGAAADAGNGNVWSWNISPQAVSNLVLDVAVAKDGYTIADSEGTVTFSTYKVGGTAISNFEAANVYNFALSFASENISGVDGTATLPAEITVTIGSWVINETEIGF